MLVGLCGVRVAGNETNSFFLKRQKMEGSMKKGWMEKVNNRVIGKFITNTILTAKITQQSNGKNCLVTPGAFYPGQLASLDHCCLEAPGQRLNNTGQNMCQCSSEPQ